MQRFVDRYEMTGRVSEESNEAYNGTLKEVKRILRCMVSDEQRIQKITERSQANVNGGVVEKRIEIENNCKGKARGPYEKRSRQVGGEEILRREEEIKEYNGERFVVIDGGNWLPERWFDIYEWFLSGKAPKDWIQRLAKTASDDFTEIERISEMHSKLV